ncbi:molybdopterin-binding protein, partial [Bacillus subtilis]
FGDNPDRLKQVIRIAEERSYFIIFSGGLAPTPDDLPKETIANTRGRPLVLKDEAFQSIEEYFKRTTRTISPN